jgi:hypothetical protein
MPYLIYAELEGERVVLCLAGVDETGVVVSKWNRPVGDSGFRIPDGGTAERMASYFREKGTLGSVEVAEVTTDYRDDPEELMRRVAAEQDCIRTTEEHIGNVRLFMRRVLEDLADRRMHHDESKMVDPELPVFAEYTPKLAGSTYGSDEYKEFLRGMSPALEHHYAVNRHHPEHFKDGVHGMTLVDLLEMVCDWKAASFRHKDGDIFRSIDISEKRFELSSQLTDILRNTAKEYLQDAAELGREFESTTEFDGLEGKRLLSVDGRGADL